MRFCRPACGGDLFIKISLARKAQAVNAPRTVKGIQGIKETQAIQRDGE